MTVARKKMFDYLPAIYQEPEWRPDAKGEVCPICGQHEQSLEHKNHLGEFLEAFEKVLFGFDEDGDLDGLTGLGLKVERLYELFDPDPVENLERHPEQHPRRTPARFLPWLAGFAALRLPAGISENRERKLIAHIIDLYHIRGTKAYLEKLLGWCLEVTSAVSEEEMPPMQLGVRSTIGSNTYLGGGPPHFFRVNLDTRGLDASRLEAQRQIAHEVIELAKPAHTTYELTFISPRMQIGVHSTIGLDTVLPPAAA